LETPGAASRDEKIFSGNMIILGKSLQQDRESLWEILSPDQLQKRFSSSLLIGEKKIFQPIGKAALPGYPFAFLHKLIFLAALLSIERINTGQYISSQFWKELKHF